MSWYKQMMDICICKVKRCRPREQEALKLPSWGNAFVGRLNLEEENDQLLPSRCMNPNLTSMHDLMVDTHSASQAARASRNEGQKVKS
jgi:hypothetical protein